MTDDQYKHNAAKVISGYPNSLHIVQVTEPDEYDVFIVVDLSEVPALAKQLVLEYELATGNSVFDESNNILKGNS